MSNDAELFEDLPEQRRSVTGAAGRGGVRLREARRDEASFQLVELDALLTPEHPARAVWAFVDGLDLEPLRAAVKAREGVAGRPPADPKILVALWLYATIDGVGSARALAGLCESHIAYRWICGGVSMNHHGLSDFRVGQEALLDRMLVQGVTGLVSAGLVHLERLAQDGVRVRASAGTRSYRRRARLETQLAQARARVEELKKEIDSDPGASTARQKAAQARAAREREARVAAALERLKQLEEERARREKTHKKDTAKQKEPRASTTDSEARNMKMADGGFRPAYNAQFSSDPETQVIVGVDLDTTGSDGGLMMPMIDQIEEDYGTTPREYLVDGGYTKLADIEKAHEAGIVVFTPLLKNKQGTDPAAPRESDGPGVAKWRVRMASAVGKETYKERAKAECVNAQFRNWTGYRLLVRGKEKVRTVLLWFAVAHNFMRGMALQAKAKAAPSQPAAA